MRWELSWVYLAGQKPMLDRVVLLSFWEGAPLANGTADTTHFSDLNGHVDVTFNDWATHCNQRRRFGLPDTTTTLPLLGMAFAGLCGFAKRFRK